MLSFVSIKGILLFDAKAIEFRETTKIARYITKVEILKVNDTHSMGILVLREEWARIRVKRIDGTVAQDSMRTESEMSFVFTLGNHCKYCKQKNDYYCYG